MKAVSKKSQYLSKNVALRINRAEADVANPNVVATKHLDWGKAKSTRFPMLKEFGDTNPCYELGYN